MAKIFVTGASGFIGTEICRVAVMEGHSVVGLVRTGRPENVDSWADQVTWVQGNALVPDDWRDALEGADAVIHTVGILREKSQDRKSTRLNSSHVAISYAVLCLHNK